MKSNPYLIIPRLKVLDDAILPHLVRTLTVQNKSSALIEYLTNKGYGEDHEISIVPQDNETGADSEYAVTAKVLKISAPIDNAYKMQIQTQERVRIISTLEEDANHPSRIEAEFAPFEHDAEESRVLSLVDIASKTLPSNPIPGVKSDGTGLMEMLSYLSIQKDILSSAARLEILEVGSLSFYIETLISEFSQAKLKHEVLKERDADVASTTRALQKDAIIRQQIKALQKQLSDPEDDAEDLESRIDAATVPDDVRKELNKQAKRLKIMQVSSSEYPVTLNYIETLLTIPWMVSSEEQPLLLADAKALLDAHHYGLEKTKKRIMEYLAVCALKPDTTPPLLCLVGPPGTGKSTIAKSIAETLGRKFDRISLGGVSDENEMRGHRRTYVGSMPGRFVKTLLKVGVNNPVILLDEIDKLGRDHRGDPAAALLEILDPDQNATFTDHYVDVPLDLSKCIFITTANDLQPIPAPLRDRMEIIEIPSYTLHEKAQIAVRHILPRMCDQHGISLEQVEFEDDVFESLISDYTREAGVRSLSKRMADICRHIALQIATENVQKYTLTKQALTDILGPERYTHDKARKFATPGVVTGLAWTPFGGDILSIEVSVLSGKGDLKITGNLGDVMKESAQAAFTCLRRIRDIPRDIDLHVHVPAGATPKDGPSAGVTIFTAMVSAFDNVSVSSDVAMSGEITITGDVLAVGGIREKLVAAHRAGIKRIYLPASCEKDLYDVPESVQKDLTITFITRIEDIQQHIPFKVR